MFNQTKNKITEFVKNLHPGKLVRIRYMDGDEVAMYVTRSKDKKTWQRMYYFLAQGRITGIRHNMLMFVEELNQSET